MRETLKTEVLTIDVIIDDFYEVKEGGDSACMITFHGKCDCPNFKGNILPGGVDTQKQLGSGERTLSARYILEGTDSNKQKCRIFIENNGTVNTDGSIITKPTIITDSLVLGYLNHADLTGTVSPVENGVKIRIFTRE